MDLDAIEKRAAKYAEHTGTLRCCNAHDTADDVPGLVARVRELEEENQRIHSAVRRVHAPYDIVPGMPVCRECHPRYDGDDAPYPCPTIRALERARQLSEGGK